MLMSFKIDGRFTYIFSRKFSNYFYCKLRNCRNICLCSKVRKIKLNFLSYYFKISKSAFGSSAAYSNSTLDNKMTSIYNSLPEKLQSKIMDATFALEGSGSITRKVFALTYTMVGFGVNNGTTEGKALQRYNSNANRKKKYSGSAGSWWLSSRRNTSTPRDVSTVGAVDYNRPDFSSGVVPAFVIPADVVYDPTPNADGSYNLVL